MHIKPRFLLAAAFAALLSLLSAPAWAAGELTATPAGCATYTGNRLDVHTGGPCTITMTTLGATTTTDYINVDAGATAAVTLQDVSIDVSGVSGTPAFYLDGPPATVNLTLVGVNKLVSGKSASGLDVSAGRTLTIDGSGSLTATGGDSAAGIGSYDDNGSIIINSGTVVAHGGNSTSGTRGGAGIGGGVSGSITIAGAANVTATGGNAASAGVGGGAGIGSRGTQLATPIAAGAINISPAATVNATGGTGTAPGGNGATIGQGGYNGGNGAAWIPPATGTAPIPTLGQWALMLLALLLGGAAARTVKGTARP